MTRPSRLDDAVVLEWLASHAAWRLDDGHLVRDVESADYPSAVAMLVAQVELCERLDHHPIVTVGYRNLRFEVWTHDRRGLTQLDLDYAEGLESVLAGVDASQT